MSKTNIVSLPGARRRAASPLAVLRALFARLRGTTHANRIAVDIGEEQLARHSEGLVRGVCGARRIESHIDGHRSAIAAALTDERSPGIIDEHEARELTRRLTSTGQHALRHRQHLESLT